MAAEAGSLAESLALLCEGLLCCHGNKVHKVGVSTYRVCCTSLPGPAKVNTAWMLVLHLGVSIYLPALVTYNAELFRLMDAFHYPNSVTCLLARLVD